MPLTPRQLRVSVIRFAGPPEQLCRAWVNPEHVQGVPVIQGRARRCCSQEGNALRLLLVLGLDDERCDQLARNLLKWQCPDGGWNCDKKPQAVNSSFHETLIPARPGAVRACAKRPPGQRRPSGRSLVNWGGVSRRRMNEFVTVDALYVLKAAGRL